MVNVTVVTVYILLLFRRAKMIKNKVEVNVELTAG